MEDCKLATAAANWWIDLMKFQCKKLSPDKIIENDSNIEIIDNSLAEDFSRFHEVLKNEILSCLKKHNSLSITCCCGIPASKLRKLAQKASISTAYFPDRAVLEVQDSSVKVSVNGENLRKLRIPAEQL